MNRTETYLLSNEEEIPVVGFGTWQAPEGEITQHAVLEALAAGYRHIDTAAIYGNEKSVGWAIKKSGIPRSEIFVTTKLWNDVLTYEQAQRAINDSLARLGLEYLDLYLIHWPDPAKNRPHNEKRNSEVWRAMEEAVEAGKIKSIGVSNFHERHLEPLLKTARIKPVVNQIYLNPGDQQGEVVDYNRKHKILTEAYSPLGTGKILDDEVLNKIAQKHGVTAAQVALRWSIDSGFLPLPKSVTDARIFSNFDLFDFALTPEDRAILDALDGTIDGARNPDQVDF